MPFLSERGRPWHMVVAVLPSAVGAPGGSDVASRLRFSCICTEGKMGQELSAPWTSLRKACFSGRKHVVVAW